MGYILDYRVVQSALYLFGMSCHSFLPNYEMGNTQSASRRGSVSIKSTSNDDVTTRSTPLSIQDKICSACGGMLEGPRCKAISALQCGHKLHVACIDALIGRDYDPLGNLQVGTSVQPISSVFRSIDALRISHVSHIKCPRCMRLSVYDHTYLDFLKYMQNQDIHNMKDYIQRNGKECINRVDKNGHSLLMVACKEGKIETVRFLLQHGADNNLRNRHGYNSSQYVDSIEIMDLLSIYNLNYSDSVSDYTSTIPRCISPMSSIYSDDHCTRAPSTHKNKTISTISTNGFGFKHRIAKTIQKPKRTSFTKKLESWIANQVPITLQNENEVYHHLRQATRNKDHKKFDLIMDFYKLMQHQIYFDTHTAICVACVAIDNDNDYALSKLIHQAIDPNSVIISKTKSTFLHYAVIKRALKCTHVLLGHHAIDVNIQNVKGDTPLHIASRYECVDFLKALLAHPAININASNVYGLRPIHEALNSIDAIETIEKQLLDKEYDCIYINASETYSPELDFLNNPCVDLLLGAGADVSGYF